MPIKLEVTQGPHQGRSFTFDGHDNFIVGRARCAHFRLRKKDPYFSRIHFMIEVNPPHCYVMDMGSTNGTRVNGQRVQAAYLGHGDLIQGGDTVIRVSLVDQPEERVEEMPSPPPPPPAPGQPPVRAVPPPLPGRPAEPAPAVPPEMAVPPPTPQDPRLLSTESFHGVSPEVPVKPPRAEPVSPDEAPAIPGYQIVGRLGRGGMGVVYLGTRVSDGAEVALKTIALGSSAPQRDIQRFLREANILRQLQHPNIVTFHDMGRQGETLYFVMDYVAGTDAGSLLVHQGPMRIGRAVRLVCQALEALHYAHGQGFVHRDVKPANLLISGEPGREICKVADFGLARVYQASVLSGITMLGESGGTPDYMPPEQITHYRDVRPAADQYAAAATLYCLLTGRHLYDFSGLSPAKRLTKILFDEPQPIRDHRRDVPEPLAEVIHRALERDPAARFPDAAAFRDAVWKSGGGTY